MKSVQLLAMNQNIKSGYGYLYNGYAALDANMFPTDWELPSSTDWDDLITSVGGNSLAGGRLKELGFYHWDYPNTVSGAYSGFAALPGGIRDDAGDFVAFFPIKQYGFYRGSTEISTDNYYYVAFTYNNLIVDQNNTNLKFGMSLKAIYTGAGTPATVTDNDGNIIPVKLMPDGKYWTVQNWKCTTMSKTPFAAIDNVTDNTDWSNLITPGRCVYNNDSKYL